MVRLTVAQGALLSRVLRANDLSGAPVVGKYLSTDPINCLIWPAGATQDSALAVIPTGSWLPDQFGDAQTGATNGQWTYQLSDAQTASLPAGFYRTSAKATHGTDVDDLLEGDLIITGTGGALSVPAAAGVSGPSATVLNLVSTLYCTDENIAVRCVPDFTTLQPDSQMLAWGSDGLFLNTDPWTLISPSNNFTNQLPAIWSQQGAAYLSAVGYVIWLRKPQSAFPAGGILMAIAAVNGTSLTLRRLGMPAGWGVAPAPSTGLKGVEFQICTFYPQIENACDLINRKYNISTTIPGRLPASLEDLRPLRSTTIAMVLADRYSDESRAGTGDYNHKVGLIKNELSDLRAMLQLRWLSGFDSTPQTSNFYTRISR